MHENISLIFEECGTKIGFENQTWQLNFSSLSNHCDEGYDYSFMSIMKDTCLLIYSALIQIMD